MNSKCLDPNLGKLLHAYELGLLGEEELKDFEMHMLKCQYCFSLVEKFASRGEMLCYDKKVVEETKHSIKSKLDHESMLTRIWKYMWPDLPLPLKPAVLVALIMVLLYPSYLGFFKLAPEEIRNVSHINLYSSRSSTRGVFQINFTKEVILSFVYRDALIGHKYEITLFDNSEKIVYHSNHFDEFDKYETGRLLLPAKHLKSGLYTLEIQDPDNKKSDSKMVYLFNVGTK